MALPPTPARTGNSGDVKVLCRETTFAVGDGGTFEIGVCPAGYVVDKASSGVIVEEVFNAGTANTVDIGISGTTTAFATALSLTAKDFVPLGNGGNLVIRERTPIIATFALTGTTATAGKAVLRMVFNRIETD